MEIFDSPPPPKEGTFSEMLVGEIAFTHLTACNNLSVSLLPLWLPVIQLNYEIISLTRPFQVKSIDTHPHKHTPTHKYK